MDGEWLAERFEAERPRLQAVAYRILGSASEADDAVQEAWLRLSRADADALENLGGWLTTVVARVCLDMLRARRSRREEPLTGEDELRPDASDPEHEALLAESVGSALVVVLQHLAPAERVAFVLHDMFGVSFDEIARIVGRSPVAARQLASRARRRVQGAADDHHAADLARHQAIVEAFFRASRDGDLPALLALLDPDAVVRSDEVVVRMAAARGVVHGIREVRGAKAVAEKLAGLARAAQLALLDGVPGAVWAPKGRPVVVFAFTIRDGKITSIELAANPERLRQLNVQILA